MLILSQKILIQEIVILRFYVGILKCKTKCPVKVNGLCQRLDVICQIKRKCHVLHSNFQSKFFKGMSAIIESNCQFGPLCAAHCITHPPMQIQCGKLEVICVKLEDDLYMPLSILGCWHRVTSQVLHGGTTHMLSHMANAYTCVHSSHRKK